MRYCKNCGLLAPLDADHCPQCGAPLPPDPAVRPGQAPGAPLYHDPEPDAPDAPIPALTPWATLGALLYPLYSRYYKFVNAVMALLLLWCAWKIISV